MDYSNTETRFHLSRRAERSANNSKHNVLSELGTVKKILMLNPDYGVPVSGFGALRKMRVAVPKYNMGKSSGYRLVYRKAVVEEVVFIALLELYFKGDRADLSQSEYQVILEESEVLLNSLLDVAWG